MPGQSREEGIKYLKTCPVCEEGVETVWHAVWSYPKAQLVWNSSTIVLVFKNVVAQGFDEVCSYICFSTSQSI